MRYLTDPCPQEQAFRFQNGAQARSLQEFTHTIDQVPPEVVQYHREHFHHWVKDILGDAPLAERVRAEGQRARDGLELRRTLHSVLEPALKNALPKPSGVFRR